MRRVPAPRPASRATGRSLFFLARRRRLLIFGLETRTSKRLWCLSAPPLPQDAPPRARARTTSCSGSGFVLGSGRSSECERRSGSTRNLASGSLTGSEPEEGNFFIFTINGAYFARVTSTIDTLTALHAPNPHRSGESAPAGVSHQATHTTSTSNICARRRGPRLGVRAARARRARGKNPRVYRHGTSRERQRRERAQPFHASRRFQR